MVPPLIAILLIPPLASGCLATIVFRSADAKGGDFFFVWAGASVATYQAILCLGIPLYLWLRQRFRAPHHFAFLGLALSIPYSLVMSIGSPNYVTTIVLSLYGFTTGIAFGLVMQRPGSP